ncbi:hypothetical protein V2G26_015167 [Clonostachys chloroleuca]
MSLISLSSVSPDETIIKLPHPYLTEYAVKKVPAPSGNDAQFFQLALRPSTRSHNKQPSFELHSSNLRFTEPTDLKSSEAPPPSNNGAWGRARRSPAVAVNWESSSAPTLAQAWLLLYLLFTVRPSMESVRLELKGRDANRLGQQLQDVLLAIDHPTPPKTVSAPSPSTTNSDEKVVLALRSTFWQGAGSPFGPRPVWCPDESPSSLPKSTPLASYPLTPVQHTISVASAGDPQDPDRYQQAWHPVRPAKPAPGATIYSRYIPHLKKPSPWSPLTGRTQSTSASSTSGRTTPVSPRAGTRRALSSSTASTCARSTSTPTRSPCSPSGTTPTSRTLRSTGPRRTAWAATSTPAISTAAGTLSSAMCASADRTACRPGGAA